MQFILLFFILLWLIYVSITWFQEIFFKCRDTEKHIYTIVLIVLVGIYLTIY